MTFNFQQWNRVFITKKPYNDAVGYGIYSSYNQFAEYPPIGIHHLTGPENVGKHNIFFDVLGIDGQRVPDIATRFLVGWKWQDQRPGELSNPVRLDKPLSEPAGNIDMWPGQVITVWLIDARSHTIISNEVRGLQSGHDDEEPGNTRFHHSFYVVFQQNGNEPPEPEPEPDEIVGMLILDYGKLLDLSPDEDGNIELDLVVRGESG